MTALLDGADIAHLDYGDQVKATWQGVLDGIDLARREGVDAVVEIGGASAMDTGKAIALPEPFCGRCWQAMRRCWKTRATNAHGATSCGFPA